MHLRPRQPRELRRDGAADCTATSLIQTCGRAARNVEGRVIFYADVITGSIRATVDEVERRRKLQTIYNVEHGIEPATIIKPVRDSLEALYEMDYVEVAEIGGKTKKGADPAASWGVEKLRGEMAKLRDDMLRASSELRFEEVAKLRDRLRELEQLELAR